jgi:putative SOS response-associated peptidase YedK
MCFYYALVKVRARALIENKIVDEKQLEMFDDKFIVSGFDHPQMPVITNENPEAVQRFYWGFVPNHMTSKERADEFVQKYNTLNAKGETIFERQTFKEAIKRKRCLVLCSGFFEWRHQKVEGKKKAEKYPFYITLKNNEMFVFGGVWDSFTDRETGEVFNTFSIVTTQANDLMEVVHNSKMRMPLIIDPEKAMNWLSDDLSDDEIKSFIKPFDPKQMKAKPIAKINPFVLKNFDNPSVTAYYQYPELMEILPKEFFEDDTDLR